MAAEKVRSDYEGLKDVADKFLMCSDIYSLSTQQNLSNKMDKLRGGDWVGKGADKFYAEMDGSVFPTLKRLTSALDKAGRVTGKIAQIMKQAEGDASGCFKL
jgi:WXG100 family type VII secretion target